jgi:uncharacterized protein YjbI with pentapeptide repeats
VTPPTGSRIQVEAPDLPQLERWSRDQLAVSSGLLLDGVLLDLKTCEPIHAERIQVAECRLAGVALAACNAPGLKLTDVVLRDCDLSNVDGREGSLNRVEVHHSRLVGFGVVGGTARDLTVIDSSLALASFAFAKLRNVVFQRVKLTDASFMEARLERVAFLDCELAGSDFRGVKLKDCAIRGTSLEGVLGVSSMKGLAMPWPDIVASAAALADGLGISVETE